MIIIGAVEYIGGIPFVDAHIRCDGCGATSASQGGCGAHAKVTAEGLAKAHAKVTQGWGHTYEPGRLGRERVSMQRDKCPACLPKNG